MILGTIDRIAVPTFKKSIGGRGLRFRISRQKYFHKQNDVAKLFFLTKPPGFLAKIIRFQTTLGISKTKVTTLAK